MGVSSPTAAKSWRVVASVTAAALGAPEARNEDRVGMVDLGDRLLGWVIDGGTSVAEQNYVDQDVGDVVWFADRLSSAIENAAPKHLSLRDIHAEASQAVSDSYFAAVQTKPRIPEYAKPIAALTIAQVIRGVDKLEVFALGDCPAYFVTDANEVKWLHADAATMDEKVNSLVAEQQARLGANPQKVWTTLLPQLRQRRIEQITAKRLEISTVANRAQYAGHDCAISADEASALFLMTDGFARYFAQYRIGSPENLAHDLLNLGGDPIVRNIRNFERSDANGELEPRLKTSDDASCLVIGR
jgi:Protein phosphatase 2C